ncbi:MAG: DUF5519 family protein [Ardenticatenaceae bacterium]|nr:DUF5519 family protein [Ardenticatenaceae bacterium]
MSVQGAQKAITNAVRQWDGVIDQPHRFGGVEYVIGRREIGHIHGNFQLDIPFPKRVRDELLAAGQAEPHHILPDSGWITFYLRRDEDVESGIQLLKRSYDLAQKQKKRRNP